METCIVVLTFEAMVTDHSNETSSEIHVLSHGAICFSILILIFIK